MISESNSEILLRPGTSASSKLDCSISNLHVDVPRPDRNALSRHGAVQYLNSDRSLGLFQTGPAGILAAPPARILRPDHKSAGHTFIYISQSELIGYS